MTTSGSRQRLLTVPPFHADQSRDFVPLPLRFRVLSGLWPLARTCTTPKIQLQQQRSFSVHWQSLFSTLLSLFDAYSEGRSAPVLSFQLVSALTS